MCPLASQLLPPSHFHPNSLQLFFLFAKQNAVIIAASHIQIISFLHRFNLFDIFIIFCIGRCRWNTLSALSLFENKYYWSNLNRKFSLQFYFSFSKLCSFSYFLEIYCYAFEACEREHLSGECALLKIHCNFNAQVIENSMKFTINSHFLLWSLSRIFLLLLFLLS